ncbi:MAG: ATP synthase F1 subunit epsilon [Acidobacteriota bacterium]|nr:ATP synthase F1 subunit epsilon [Acidobacteriota bacterium]
MANDLTLVIVTPESSVLEETCDSVSLPATLGYVTILPRHTPMVSTLAVGIVAYQQGTQSGALALSGGFFEVSDDTVTVLADTAELPTDIDIETARQALQEAKASMGQLSGPELSQARRTVELSEARIAVAG